MITIPQANPGAENALYRAEIDQAIARVLDSGRYLGGAEVEAFEREFASFVGVPHAVGVSSGTDGLALALASLGIGSGDEVLTVSHTAVATLAAIVRTGASPVLVDVDPRTLTMDPRLLEKRITRRTKAIVPVHLYGNAAPLDEIGAVAAGHGLRVVEDACQAHGTRYCGTHTGSRGDAGVFSFYPTKSLGALGDAGMVVTRDPQTAERLRLLREYGWRERYVSEIHGWNSRLDELQAAVLRVKLRRLPSLLERRREIASLYLHAISAPALRLPVCDETVEHSYHLFVVRSRARDELRAHLAAKGVGTLVHYPVPVHLQPGYAPLCAFGPLPESERAAREVLSLPLHGALSPEDALVVIDAVNSFAGAGHGEAA